MSDQEYQCPVHVLWSAFLDVPRCIIIRHDHGRPGRVATRNGAEEYVVPRMRTLHRMLEAKSLTECDNGECVEQYCGISQSWVMSIRSLMLMKVELRIVGSLL